jgi:hypothetical protein
VASIFSIFLAPEWYAEIGRDMRYAKIVDLDVVGSNPITRPNLSIAYKDNLGDKKL